jgi:hypothetical protein
MDAKVRQHPKYSNTYPLQRILYSNHRIFFIHCWMLLKVYDVMYGIPYCTSKVYHFTYRIPLPGTYIRARNYRVPGTCFTSLYALVVCLYALVVSLSALFYNFDVKSPPFNLPRTGYLFHFLSTPLSHVSTRLVSLSALFDNFDAGSLSYLPPPCHPNPHAALRPH